MGRGNNRRGGRGGGGGGRGGGGQGRANASEAAPNQAAPEQPKQPKPSKQQQNKSKKQKNQEPAEPAGEAGMGWTRRNRDAQQQQQQQQAEAPAAARAEPQAKPAAPTDTNAERNARGEGRGRGGGDNRRTGKNRGGNGRGRGNAKGNGKGRGGGDNAAANKQPTAEGAENAATEPNDKKKKNNNGKKGKGGNNNKHRNNRSRGADNNAKAADGADVPKADLPAIAAPQPRKKATPAGSGPTDDAAAATAEGYDRTTGKQGKRRVRPAGKKGNKKGGAKPSHSDPFADPVGEHRHTERTEPENVHGHALLEGDVEGSGSDLPEALRSGMSSSAMGEEGEEVASSDGEGDGTDEDFSDTANERQKEYRPGGYHPVYIGEVYNERYRVVHKLGWGYFSTVWLVWDYKGHGFHAMKVQKSAQHYRDAAYDEIKLLTQIMGADPTSEHCCARMTDSFEHIGPHGTHVVMIFDVLGENLLKLMERYEYKGIPIPIVKAIAKQTLIGLRHIHSIEIIHTDLKPENVLLQTPKHGIVNIMKRYKAPAVSENLSLLERDRSMMTKSQRRRYDAKVRKLKREANEKQGDAPAAVAATASESGSDDEGSTTKKAAVVDPSRAAERSADGGGIDAQDLSAEVSAGVKAAEAAVNASDSDTDPEWEVQRFQNVCLADFGNSCWTYKQFADEVQTRQYRCPEVIIGDPYGCAIDLWSAACMFFELLTGEFLFDPKESGEYPRDEDHLALIMELQGPLPPHMAMGRGKFRSQFFNSHGELRHIKDLRFWGIRDVLHKKYRFSNKKANEIAEFLLPMLALDPRERATAAEMLEEFADFFDPVDDDFAPACFSTGESDEDEEAERMPRPFSCRQDAAAADDGEDEEDDVETWLANHPLLHPDQLASMGLKLDDVTTVLQGGTLPDPRKQQIVDMIIERMQEDMSAYEDEDEAAAADAADDGDDEDEEEEENDEDATTDEDTTGSEASAETPAVASTTAHVDPQAGTANE